MFSIKSVSRTKKLYFAVLVFISLILSSCVSNPDVSIGDRVSAPTIPTNTDAVDLIIVSTADEYSVNESVSTVVFTISATKPLTTPLILDYKTVSLTASTEDYIAVLGRVELGETKQEATFDITIIQDSIIESNELFQVVLVAATENLPTDYITPDYTLGGAPPTITIVDDDVAELTITSEGNLKEGSSRVFTVSSNLATEVDLTAIWTILGAGINPVEATDFDNNLQTGTIVIPANSPAGATATFTLVAVNDSDVEGNEVFTISLSNLNGGTTEPIQVGENTQFIIEDSLFTTVSITAATETVLEGIGSVVATISINNIAAGTSPFTVYYTTIDRTATGEEDYTITTGAVVLSPENVSENITIIINDDNKLETDESFDIIITNISNTNINLVDNQISATITIVDDDIVEVTISNAIALEGGVVVFTASATTESDIPITFDYTTIIDGVSNVLADQSDFIAVSNATATISAGTTLRTTTIDIQTVEDIISENNEIFTLQLSNLEAEGINGRVVFTGTSNDFTAVSGTIVDNENVFGVSVSTTTVFEAISNLVIGLSTTVNNEVSVFYQINNIETSTRDYTDNGGGQVTIPANSFINSFSIDLVDDSILEEDETFEFVVTSIVGINDVVLPDPILFTIIDNDSVVIEITSNTSITIEEGQFSAITVTLSEGTFSEIPIVLTYTTNTIGIVNPAILGEDYRMNANYVIPVGSANSDIFIEILTDNILEQAENFNVVITSNNSNVIIGNNNSVNISIIANNPVDNNNNLLIDLKNAEELNNVRYNLVGTSYKNSTNDNGVMCTIAGNVICEGYELVADIDLESYLNWVPIGPNFTSIFDGNNHTISNLIITNKNTSNGLFSGIRSASIQNLTIYNPKIATGIRSVGALAGTINSSNIFNINLISSSSNDINISNDNAYTGGLAGNSSHSNIQNVHNSLSINSSAFYVGGLVGFSFNTMFNNISNSGTVSGLSLVGGLVGDNTDSSIIRNSWSSGSVTVSGSVVGGLVGGSNSSSIINSWSNGSVFGNIAGGLAGDNFSSTIENSWAGGVVEGSNDVGGFVGINADSTYINNYWNSETSGIITGSGGIATTTLLMAASNGLLSDSAFSDWSNINPTRWRFGSNVELPTIINTENSSEFQHIYQAAGLIRLTNTDGRTFFGGSNFQDTINVSANAFNSGDVLAIFDINAAASNNINLLGFSACSTSDSNFFTTTGINNTTITVIIADGTTHPANWSKGVGDFCEIRIDNIPLAGDSLNLLVEITKGSQTATKNFNIEFFE